MKVKEILELQENKNGDEQFERMMTNEEFTRMHDLGIDCAWKLLDMMADGARLSGVDEDDEFFTISAYLDYLKNMKD